MKTLNMNAETEKCCETVIPEEQYFTIFHNSDNKMFLNDGSLLLDQGFPILYSNKF